MPRRNGGESDDRILGRVTNDRALRIPTGDARDAQAALQRGVVAVLDVGTSKIACLVLRFDGTPRMAEAEEVGRMAGQAGFRVIGAATTRSRGVRFGEIDAMVETERAIRTAVQAAQRMADMRVDHVIACFSGAGPRSYGLAGEVELEARWSASTISAAS